MFSTFTATNSAQGEGTPENLRVLHPQIASEMWALVGNVGVVDGVEATTLLVTIANRMETLILK